MATGKNLSRHRKRLCLTLDQLSDISGVERGTIGALEVRDSKRSDFFGKLAKALGMTVEQLEDESYLADDLSPSPNTQSQSQYVQSGEFLPQPTEEEFALVKQLDLSASCGPGRFVDHIVVKGGLAFKRSSLRDLGVQEENARIIYASGDSMEPSISHGRVVLVDTADIKAEDNRVFLICDPDGSILLKRLVREFHPGSGHMRWIMRSDNPNKTHYPDKLLPDDDRTKIVGRAIWTDKML